MNRAITLIGSIGLGAGLMYLFDPSCGRRRRAFVRGKFVKAAHEMEHTFDAAARDVQHRAQGVMSRVQSSLSNHKVVPKEVLIERVRSQIGRAVSHPHAIHVDAQDGRIALSGPILQSEVGCLLAAVSSVRGVTGIANYLEVHSQSDGIAALQGQGHSAGHQPTRWPPATRLLAGAVGCGLMANCAVRPTPIPIALGTLGFGLFLRAWTNLELRRLTGISGRRVIDVHKTINIGAPIEQVFEFWTNYDNFPRFMSHVREVRQLDGDRSHWVAVGPGGTSFSWDATLTRVIPYALLAWRSTPGSLIANAGTIRFDPIADRSTHVDIQLCYNPPAGVLGHLAALVFGADPKSAMDEDLVRLKSLLEHGKASAPGKQVLLEELTVRESNATPVLAGSRMPTL